MTTRKGTMQNKRTRWHGLIAAALIGLTLPSITQAAEPCVDVNIRPLDDFLGAQGSQVNFFPPVPDYVGWVGADFLTFGLVDYAGVAATYLAGVGVDLETEVRGLVAECELLDGTAQVTVALVTHNAMGLAQDIAEIVANNFDFAATNTVFGNKAVEIAAGAPAALGSAELYVSFHIDSPGDPLPDLIDVVNLREGNGKLSYGPVIMTFTSVIEDDGYCLTINQEGTTSANGKEMLSQVPFLLEQVDVAECPLTD